DVPLLGVVRDRWLPSTGGGRISPPMTVPVAAEPRRGPRLVLVALLVAALAVGGWALLARARESALVAPPAAPLSTPSTTSTPSTNLHRQPVAVPDTLGWTVQLAAYASLDKALAHADRLAA